MFISVTEFKAKCLRIIDQVQRTKRSVAIIRHGRVAAKLVPADNESTGAWHGRARQTTRIKGDLLSTGERWHADA